MNHTACNERIEERGMHQSEVREEGRASDRLAARLSDVWKEGRKGPCINNVHTMAGGGARPPKVDMEESLVDSTPVPN